VQIAQFFFREAALLMHIQEKLFIDAIITTSTSDKLD